MKTYELNTSIEIGKNNIFSEIFLVIRPTLLCNLNCSYCYIAAKNRKLTGILSDSIMERFLQVLINLGCKTVYFSWQGGEPTLIGRPRLQTLIDTADRILGNANVNTYHCLHTNGILIDDDWAKFFLDRSISVGVSLDAGRDVHDHYRRPWSMTRSYSTFDRAMVAINTLCMAGLNVEATSTIVEPNNMNVEETYAFFRSLPVQRINVEPCLSAISEKCDDNVNSWLQPYVKFLGRLYRLWKADSAQKAPIHYFDMLQKIIKGHHSDACHMSGNCWNHLMLQPNGDVFPCDQFGDYNSYRVGNVNDINLGYQLLNMPNGVLGMEAVCLKSACADCKWFSICNGGCLYQRLSEFGLCDRGSYPNQCNRNWFFSQIFG